MTENIITKNYGNRHHITDITVTQQQLENLRPTGKLNIIDKQDHEMINIEELLNDWLKEVV